MKFTIRLTGDTDAGRWLVEFLTGKDVVIVNHSRQGSANHYHAFIGEGVYASIPALRYHLKKTGYKYSIQQVGDTPEDEFRVIQYLFHTKLGNNTVPCYHHGILLLIKTQHV